jgi:secreted PhoX family phosphatase
MSSTLAGSVGASGSTDGTNSSARFNGPYGITVYGNNVYVADKYCSTIRNLKQVGANWVVSTIAGLPYTTGSADGIGSAARFNNPTGIAVDGSGNLYVADQGNSTIRRLSSAGTNWVVFTVAGLAGSSGSTDGIGSAARFNGPYAIAADNNTNVYVADSLNSTIRGTLSGSTPSLLVVQMARQTTGNTCMLTWNAVIGQTYLVQFKTNMLQTVWYPLTSVTASNLTCNACVPIGPDPQRFYRIVP